MCSCWRATCPLDWAPDVYGEGEDTAAEPGDSGPLDPTWHSKRDEKKKHVAVHTHTGTT